MFNAVPNCAVHRRRESSTGIDAHLATRMNIQLMRQQQMLRVELNYSPDLAVN